MLRSTRAGTSDRSGPWRRGAGPGFPGRLALWLGAAVCLLLTADALGASVRPTEPALAWGWGNLVDWLRRGWNFNLIHVGDRAVRVSQVVFAIITLVVGLLLSRWFTRFVSSRLRDRFRVSPGAAGAVGNILFYVLVLIVILMALQVVAVPLTLFAFLGGAVAIALGFGAQNILSNFISGLILMLERPVRAGDLIEVDGSVGRVEEIRYRCTRIRRTDGIDVMVPNSKLLEQNVTNWTLADRRVRTSVKVGVTYGSDTARVRQILERTVQEHERVLRTPEPIILFEEFGDNALQFEVFFWAEIASIMDLRILRSDVRFRIDQEFRDAGVVIAFPQRDTHLDTARPLEVRLVQGGAGGGDTAGEPEPDAGES